MILWFLAVRGVIAVYKLGYLELALDEDNNDCVPCL